MRRKEKLHWMLRVMLALTAVMICLFGLEEYSFQKYLQTLKQKQEIAAGKNLSGNTGTDRNKMTLKECAKERGFSESDYPVKLRTLYEKNEEARSFVIDYPNRSRYKGKVSLKECGGFKEPPLFMQWDKRWGYDSYAGGCVAVAGCGPTCLSMAAVFLTKNTEYDPGWMATFAEQNGYDEPGNGSKWSLIFEGAKKLGINTREISNTEEQIEFQLKAGNLLICVVGPGDFTDSGHFLLMTGYEDGKIKLNDPNSRKNSRKLWGVRRIRRQIKAMWVLKK